MVDDGDLVTAGGVTSGIDMALWLVERHFWGRAGRGRGRRDRAPAPRRGLAEFVARAASRRLRARRDSLGQAGTTGAYLGDEP